MRRRGSGRSSGRGGYVFENEWQSFRTRKDRGLELVSAAREVSPGRRKLSAVGMKNKLDELAVKVVDIFGNDTMKTIKVNI